MALIVLESLGGQPVRARNFLKSLFDAAVAAADPEAALRGRLPPPPAGRTVVIGAGKGAAQLAAALERLWPGPLEGVVVTRYGHGAPTRAIDVLEASHPVPDAAGLDASRRLMAAVRGLTADDLVIALICGGGSALLPAPGPGMSLADEIAVNEALLASGAPIADMNTVRAQISAIKGGRLAAMAHPARVVSFVMSDIPGDDPALVASGPTVARHVEPDAARRVAVRWRLALPPAAERLLDDPAAAPPAPSDPRLVRADAMVIASAATSLDAAARAAKAMGVRAAILSDAIEGEAREVARVHAAIAREIALRGRPFRAPVVLLSGGETTVTLGPSPGEGGRNSTFALAFARDVAGLEGVTLLAADTDGVDGIGGHAGAFADGATVARLRASGLDAGALLDAHDSRRAFASIGDLFDTGPTGVNVNDFRAVLVGTAPD